MGWTVRQGLTTATGVVVAVLAALLLGLQDPWWSAISAWVVAAPDRHMMLAKAAQRVMGTLLGLADGLVRLRLEDGTEAAVPLAAISRAKLEMTDALLEEHRQAQELARQGAAQAH